MPLLNNSSSYAVVGGDISGSVNDAKVLNISNVVSGVLGTNNGGTGLTNDDLVINGIKYWNGLSYSFLTGSIESSALYWDGAKWAIREDKLSLVDDSFYNIFSVIQQPNMVVVTDENGFNLRVLSSDDLPEFLDGKIITNSSVQGEFAGSIDATIAVIANAEILDGTVNAILSGDGSGITNLSLANISDISSIVDNGLYAGNGIAITNLNDEITVSLENEISVTSVTADSYYGSGVGLTNVPVTALTTPYITINGVDCYLGSEVDTSNTMNISATGSNIEIESLGYGEYKIGMTQSPTFDTVYSTNFSGSGEEIYNIVEDNISGISVLQQNNFVAGQVLSYNNNLYITSSYDNNYDIVGVVVSATNNDFKYKTNYSVFVTGSTNYSIGTKLYVGSNGEAIQFSDIPSGKYAKFIGTKLENNKIFIQKQKILKIWK